MIALLAAVAVVAQPVWKELGPAPTTGFGGAAGRVSAIVCHPTDPGLYYVSGADGGVWKTTDAGATWKALTDHMPTTSMGALAMDPSNPAIVYAGTGEANFANHSRYGLGIFKTTDAGATWAHLGQSAFAGRCISKIVIDPASTSTLYAGVTRAGGFPELAAAKGHPQGAGPLGVFKSTDAGVSWTLLPGLPDLSTTDLALDPTQPATIYAAVGHIFGAPENGIYKSIDAGATWNKLGTGLPTGLVGRISIAIAPSSPQRLYALYCNPSSASGGGATTRGAFRTDDGGASWVSLPIPSMQATYGWFLNCVGVHPTNPSQAFFGGLDLVRTNNSGSSFGFVTPQHVDQHAIAWDAAGRLLAGDDGGVHRSADAGNSWTGLNTGLGTIQFYAGLSTHPADPIQVLGGLQDNGSVLRKTDTKTWTHVTGGDGGWTQINQANPLTMFAEAQGTGNLYRSLNGGNSFGTSSSGINGGDRNCFLPPYLVDPNNPSRMLYATHRIYQSTNNGGSWTAISGDLTLGAGAIRALAIAPSNSSYVYAATNDGRILRSTNAGANFTPIVEDNPGWPRVTRELFIDPTDERIVYRGIAAFGIDQVLRSVDAGATWTPLDGDLPDVPVNIVVADVRAPVPVIFAGSDAGLFRSMDDGATWARYGEGLPNACIIDILIDIPRCRLVVGTQGRGSWSVAIGGPADCDGDADLDVFDFLCYQDRFANQSPYADFERDGDFDLFDYLAFQNAFANGCG